MSILLELVGIVFRVVGFFVVCGFTAAAIVTVQDWRYLRKHARTIPRNAHGPAHRAAPKPGGVR